MEVSEYIQNGDLGADRTSSTSPTSSSSSSSSSSSLFRRCIARRLHYPQILIDTLDGVRDTSIRKQTRRTSQLIYVGENKTTKM